MGHGIPSTTAIITLMSWVEPGNYPSDEGRLDLEVGEVLLMAEIRRSPVEVGSLSHYL